MVSRNRKYIVYGKDGHILIITRNKNVALHIFKGPKMAAKKKKKELTDRQKETLKRHAEHHTPKHMAMMRKLMREGMSFTAAHKKAQKEIGK